MAMPQEEIFNASAVYRRIIDSSREMFGLWLDLKESAQSEQELSLAR